MNRISFPDTHVYPGCTAIFFFKLVSGGITGPVTAEFSDGSIAVAEAEQIDAGEAVVRIDAYTTEHGTRIPQRRGFSGMTASWISGEWSSILFPIILYPILYLLSFKPLLVD
ncbi:hypothetical protein [Niabella sp.]|uniref:hypothetical protein n=1 Tax=Niabella sp. TaxID=1962976 RepID=UPI0026250B11|nr:hypothetical protein [Niabella sp.]